MRILAERGLSSSDRDRIEALVDKYVDLLDIRGPRPTIMVRANLGSKWLGRTLWSTKDPTATTLELQQSILADDVTLERIVAHEMVHVADFLLMTEADIQKARLGITPPEHGEFFRKGAAAVNAIMGPDFVTTTSDQSYAKAESGREFYLLVAPPGSVVANKYTFAWAARLGPKAAQQVEQQRERGARLFKITDDHWTRGAKIELFGGWSIPKEPERQAQLADIYESGQQV